MTESPERAEPGTKSLESNSPFSKRRVGFLGVQSGQGMPEALAGLPELSVVVPLRNESANVLPLTRAILGALRTQPKSLELILVDDASTDGTWEQVVEAQRADSRIRPLRHLRRSGQSGALWTVFEASRGQVIATLDGDLQNDPADLPRLLAELVTCDLICGVRTQRMDNALRRISSAVARWFRKTALGVDFRDIGCNLRAFKRPVLQTLL